MSAERDAVRNRRLLFAPELAGGTISESQLARAAVREAAQPQRVPSRLSRAYQRRLLRRGALRYEGETVERAMAARTAVLGDAAAGPPRLLVRLAPPGGDVTAAAARDAHAVLAEAGVAHLVAVAPAAVDDASADVLAQLRRAGVTFGLHGVDAAVRGLDAKAIATRIDEAERHLAGMALAPEVLVAAERFGRREWDALAARFLVVAAGPEAVRWMGYHDTPQWRGEAVWMPAYPPFAGAAADALAGVRALEERGAAVWAPLVVDAQREAADGFAALRELAAAAAPLATRWPDFLDAVRASARG